MKKNERYLHALRMRIKRAMKRRNLSQRGFARLAKIDHLVVNRTLNGSDPSYTHAMRMLDAADSK